MSAAAGAPTGPIRRCRADELEAICAVINDGAQAYRGVIPADRWHEPYMPLEALRAEIEDGVEFWGEAREGELAGVMGAQDRGEVTLVRHAYVRSALRRAGIGARLLRHLEARTAKPVLIGTWAAAHWAIDFYRKHGYRVLDAAETRALLARFWKVPARQAETSVVLAGAAWPATPPV